MLFKKHPYLFVGSFNREITFLFFSESGEFNDAFAYPMLVELPWFEYENTPDECRTQKCVPSKVKWDFLTFIAHLNIILSYRHNKWSSCDIDKVDRETRKDARYKVFWNRDNIEVLEDLGIGVTAVNNLFARKNEILRRLKISQEEFDNYLPIAKEYIQHIKNKQAQEIEESHDRFFNLVMNRYINAFYLYNEQGHPFVDKHLESAPFKAEEPNYLKWLFQKRSTYPLFDEFVEDAEFYGIPTSLAVEKYMEYANKYTLPEDEYYKSEAFKLLVEMGLV
jgi:hypothetical protein